jgi:TIR domain
MPNSNLHKVFISYSRLDINTKDELLLRFRPFVLNGILEIWDDAKLQGGIEWESQIMQELNDSSSVIFLLTHHFFASEYCKKEYAIAKEKKKKIFPILISECNWKLQFESINKITIFPRNEIPILKSKDVNDSWVDLVYEFEDIFADSQNGLEASQPKTTIQLAAKTTQNWAAFFSNYRFKKSLEIAPIMSVNSDRDEHYKKQLQQHFKKHKNKQENLVYLISACPKQKPASIAKRLVYFFEDDFTDYIRHDKYQNEMRTVDLKLKSSEEGTWKVFWQTFQQDFLKEDIDYERFISNPSNWLDKQNRIALAFKIEENIWTDVGDVQEHLQFILEKFEVLPPKHRKFVFFFICRFPDVHTHRSGDCQCHLDCLDKLILPKEVAAEEFHKLHIHRLDAVKEDDVRVWANSILDSAHVDTLINELRKKLPDKSNALYNMSMIQEMQYAAYSHLRDSK